MNRKQRRALKNTGIDDAEVKLSDKIFLFNKLPDKCTVCENSFDKQDRTMVFSWKVVVREDNVRLFCPTCLKKAQEVISDTQEKD
jgi:Zn finger protein HypA/HybF involved in hydrogenase expression